MNVAARERVRLWLRSEQALGLQSVWQSRIGSGATPSGEKPLPQRSRSGAGVPTLSGGTPLPPAATDWLMGDSAAFDAPVLPREEKIRILTELNQQQVSVCKRCVLHQQRTQTVFGEGDVDAGLFFIGEGPGETEDQTGRPFVGRAGELLNKMIGAMGLRREQVFIANIVKCRPPGNRQPAPDEVDACTPYLLRQIEVVRPKVIVTLGLPATRYMLKSEQSMGRMRGQWHEWRGIKLMPTYHPAYILRQYTEEVRAAVWSDLRKVMAELGLETKK